MPGVAIAPPVLALCAPPSRPILAEVLYDAVGDDTGYEFVELFNPAAQPYPLAGLILEAGDGAGPGRWTRRWTGAAGDTIRAGGRFVIGGARVVPPPDALVQLDLQNGPDAVRLVWPDGAIEVLGYGALAYPEYSCGAPAADVAAGQSLARVPDASDLGSNALDFRAATPSPGTANHPDRDAAMREGSLALDPEQPDAGASAALTGAVINRGADPIAAGELELIVTDAGAAPIADRRIDVAIAAGDTAAFRIALPALDAGARVLRVRAALAGDEAPADDADSLRVRIGPGPLVVTEIQFHPVNGEGEWVEVRNRDAGDVAIAAFTLSDRRGVPGAPFGGRDPLARESLAVLAQDRAALLTRFPALDSTRVWQVKPWGSLNNANDSAGVADIVIVRERDGTPCARVPYSASGIPAGVPIERRDDDTWGASSDPSGTPLAPPRTLPPLAGRFVVNPRRLRGAAAPATIAWSLPWPRARIAVDLYDLDGRHVAQVLGETAVAARGTRAWTSADLPAGLYLMVMLARAEDGGGTVTATEALRVEGGRR
ncbi:MAG: hypothetical protein HYR74_10670 [Candidatus Eisenbacteria bacterium]|nr:hypothetical protein [Candidatus Eisenbacteria bacterium]